MELPIQQEIMDEAIAKAMSIVDAMCLTSNHAYGLMSEQERKGYRLTFEQIAYHDIAPLLSRTIFEERFTVDEQVDLMRLRNEDMQRRAEEAYRQARKK